jgi:hypothetical protein
MLVECLIYIVVAVLLVGIAGMLFLRCMDTAKHFSRNAGDITGALGVGERWRADLRRAVGEPAASGPDQPDFVIPVDEGHVVYLFENDAIWRSEPGDTTGARLLDRVEPATWDSEKREFTTARHFELEMQTRKKNARLRPLFSFIGVAPAEESR